MIFLSADLLIHKYKINLKGQISSKNESFYWQIQHLQSKIVGRIYREQRGLPVVNWINILRACFLYESAFLPKCNLKKAA